MVYNSDVTFDFSKCNSMTVHHNVSEPWKVTVVDTGIDTMTGGRVKRIEDYVNNETFMLTYGDGVSNIDINKLVRYHRKHGKKATITAANVAQRFGILDIDSSNCINSFREKDLSDAGKINAGFMVLEPDIFKYIEGDSTVLEKEPMEQLAQTGELMAYMFNGYWQCMDTKREMDELNQLWDKNVAPWIVW